ncbi:HEPN domain-containing protein [Streptomyces lusitanus]|uniref:HEPN domain-containing protein n=1 Tax=Streptomyces lusitanus TaxID=68232 RepID=A0ABU3JXH9_9ACTN|nr:HEPN domain-containing protein [Streptomyces lusitanus]
MGALATFHAGAQAVQALISLESVYPDPPDSIEMPKVSALRGACTVLTVASFEKFLRDLFEEELDRIRAAKIPMGLLPKKLQVEASFASLELAIKGDFSTRGLDRELRLANVLTAAKLLAKDSFEPKALAATNSNPDSACVKRMFKAVGMSDIFRACSDDFTKHWGRQEVSGFASQKLDSILDSRHQVAHTAQAMHISRPELSYNLRFIEVLTRVLHMRLSQYVDEIITSALTPTVDSSGR